MVTDIALRRLRPGAGLDFESVAPILIHAERYIQHCLIPTIDDPYVYCLNVVWRKSAFHKQLFEPSDAHVHFMAAPEPMFAKEPIVLHVPGRETYSTT